MNAPRPLVPPEVRACARSLGRLPFGFGPRFFLTLLLGFLWLVPAWCCRSSSPPCSCGIFLPSWPSLRICFAYPRLRSSKRAAYGSMLLHWRLRATSQSLFETSAAPRFAVISLTQRPSPSAPLPLLSHSLCALETSHGRATRFSLANAATCELAVCFSVIKPILVLLNAGPPRTFRRPCGFSPISNTLPSTPST